MVIYQEAGEYFNDCLFNSDDLSISNYVNKLKSIVQRLKAIPPRVTTNRNTYVSNDLLECSHVFIQHDAICKPLQQPYDEPFPVIKCTDKHFTIHMNNHDEVVSIDRLKLAYMDTSVTSDPSSSTNNVPPTETSTPSTTP